ncbi:N-acetyldiaminopimelate deacetylase [Isobaculum melis]|uniref:N-acetyldiaminopimelate deacetylase n=1 Tax=Isobaculum melis TaxID=142588 RepID=A0A1H9RJ30_9LACT|nr:N-acetyldiaminopimelate deacetylase [Isobaculum melis]SER72704.1 N-acetyldiaminopimelate deacetylase [Isobaculum melis]
MNPFIQIRRELHQIPEIGLQEFKTQAYLLEKINRLPQEHLTIKTWETAILVFVKGTVGEQTIGWRTDIDGLPITEQTGLPFASIHEGKMHACGHDLHMAIALGALSRFAEQPAENNILFFFQPAEENEAGGKLVYDAGMMDEWMPDAFYALHIQPSLPVGTIGTKIGTLFAGTNTVKIKFHGKSGHAAYPHESNDMIVAAAQLIMQAQTIVSRSVNPVEGAVITFGKLIAGTADNIITGSAELSGTIRTLTPEMNDLVEQRMREIVAGIEVSYQCKIDLSMEKKGYYPVVNSQEQTSAFITFMEAQPEVNYVDFPTAMTGEDFGYLLDKIPGTMFWLGVGCDYALHHEKISPDEAAIPFGIDQVEKWLRQQDVMPLRIFNP